MDHQSNRIDRLDDLILSPRNDYWDGEQGHWKDRSRIHSGNVLLQDRIIFFKPTSLTNTRANISYLLDPLRLQDLPIYRALIVTQTSSRDRLSLQRTSHLICHRRRLRIPIRSHWQRRIPRSRHWSWIRRYRSWRRRSRSISSWPLQLVSMQIP